MYKQLTSQQRSQIFALLQKEVKKKEIAQIIGCSGQVQFSFPILNLSALNFR